MKRAPNVKILPSAQQIMGVLSLQMNRETYEVVMKILSHITMMCLTHNHIPGNLCEYVLRKYFDGRNCRGQMLLEFIKAANDVNVLIHYNESKQRITIEILFDNVNAEFVFHFFMKKQYVAEGVCQ